MLLYHKSSSTFQPVADFNLALTVVSSNGSPLYNLIGEFLTLVILVDFPSVTDIL